MNTITIDSIAFSQFPEIFQSYFRKRDYIVLSNFNESYQITKIIDLDQYNQAKIFVSIYYDTFFTVSLTSIISKSSEVQFSELINLANSANRENLSPIKYFYDSSNKILGSKMIFYPNQFYDFGLEIWKTQVESSLKLLEQNFFLLLKNVDNQIAQMGREPKNVQQDEIQQSKPQTGDLKKKQDKNQIMLSNLRKIIDKSIYARKKSSKISKAKVKVSDITSFYSVQDQQCTNFNASEKYLQKLCSLKQNKEMPKITRTINIESITQLEEQAIFSNFSKIRKVKVLYSITESSLHKKTNQLLHQCQQQQQNFVEVKKSDILVEKTPKNNNINQPSFFTQSQIVQYLKAFESETIAEQYLQQLTVQKRIERIFSMFYPFDLFSKNPTPKRQLNSFLTISEGMARLQKIKILHRDIKPDNIMLDEKFTPKIIDFGSAVPSSPKGPRLNVSQTLKTTRMYNIVYTDLPDTVRSLISLNEFQRHQNFDMYAIGVILRNAIENQNFRTYFKGFLCDNLVWTAQKCLQYNPYDRISPSQLYGFLKFLCILVKKTKFS